MILLYPILKIYARISLYFFCRVVRVNRPAMLNIEGPVLLACNHPNSFLDAIILDVLFRQPLWSLARGDAFRSPGIVRFLTSLKILPVYRTSEGVQNLNENYNTFNSCIDLFRNNGQVIIFSEGRCTNEWHLRPLKKGTARLAMQAWQEGIPLRVLPVALNYNSFRSFGKNVFINFGEIITVDQFDLSLPDGIRNQAFNRELKNELEKGVFEIQAGDYETRRKLLVVPQPILKKLLLGIPALAGIIFHLPFYWPLKQIAKRLNNSDHYDSILTGLVVLSYPLYLVLVFVLAIIYTSWPVALLVWPVLPFTGWSAMQLKPQLDK